MRLTLVSSLVLPTYASGTLRVRRIHAKSLRRLLPRVSDNFHGHPSTIAALRSIWSKLPVPVKGRWNGEGWAMAARPRGGLRSAVDNHVEISDLEFIVFRWEPVKQENHR